MIALFFILAATFSPAAPTVGDPITLRFPAPVVLEADPSYEVVSVQGSTVVVRTFSPVPIVVRGTMGGTPFDDVVIPVRSVLAPDDALAPAPFASPLEMPPRRTPYVAFALVALFAVATWTLAWWLARPEARREVVPAIPPRERFRKAVLALRAQGERDLRWASLADETRLFLAATRPSLGLHLTTSEVLRRLHRDDAVVRQILAQGDLEKFSPWGAAPSDFETVAERALELAAEDVPPSNARDAA